MDEDRVLREARAALSQTPEEEPAVTSNTEATIGGDEPPPPAGRTGAPIRLIIAGVVVVVILLAIGGFLVFSSGSEGTENALVIERPDEGQLAIAGEMSLALSNAADKASVSRLARDSFLSQSAGEEWAAAAAAIPAHLALAGNVYAVEYEGSVPQGSATFSIPSAAQPYQTLDLYGWNGQQWRFIASTVNDDGGQLTSVEGPLPQAYALMQTAVPVQAEVGAEVLPTQSLPTAVLPLITEVTAGTITLGQGGSLAGEAVTVPSGGYRQLLRVTNTGVVVDTASLLQVLNDAAIQEQHIQTLLERVQSGGYAGLNLDYQGPPAEQRDAFTAFVNNLAQALHGQGSLLVVTLETPLTDGDQWDTAGQDWTAIGQAADAVYSQMPASPTVYDDSDQAEQLIGWATRQVDRYKLSLLVSISAVDQVGETYRELSNEQALANFGQVSLVKGSSEIEPGTDIEVVLSGSASALEWDAASLTYKYSYEQADQPHNVWLGSEAVLSHRVRFAGRYHLRGIAIRGLGQVTTGEGYAAAIESYLGTAEGPQPASAAIVWAVEDESGGVIATNTGDSLSYAWQAVEEPGVYTIRADFAQGNNVASLGSLALNVLAPPTPTPTPTPEPTAAAATPTTVASVGGAGAVQQPSPVDPGDADAAANTAANVRSGPGLSYGTVASLQTGERVSLIGRNEDRSWLQIEKSDGKQGWVFATLLTVNSSVDVGALAVVDVPPPTTAGGGGGGGGGSGGAPPPIIPPAGGGNFELGGQTHTLANPTLMSMSGMRWVKFQHKWGPGDSPSAVAGRIQQAQANGFKVLLSIPGASTYPGSIDFNAYVQFLGGVAALGPNAIEVWNEMNIDFEWPAGQIDPASYVNNMLAPAYNAIKAANSNVMVISGAPAPTGFDNGTNAWADNRYMAGMAAAGGASYMDCIGVHHNAGATSPSATSGHPSGSAHYSWYFFPTLNMYYNSFGGARQVCFTELGYLSGEDFGGVPPRFSWAANTTVQQHAQWLAEAVSLASNSGKVRLLIVFNVDFTYFDPNGDPQAGYAMLRPNGSCPACDLLRQVMGG
ncbi:MAG: SH3 domain-containing protein [Chloroflexi bacterium]|nr:SH3 domain-containing protein [Chloroflexota bacterium]MCI0578478.1 SH3 domain-containing protein [Chloroflexota bacterium]MCI0643924.1 SH3 domain-containing protein [Chloroflexota bacterium]MCI0729166.1 SH3 domain-containing protein [Chloroflexota bacterium]